MRQAMAVAVVGDDVFRDDPSILQLGNNNILFNFHILFINFVFNE